MDEAGTGHIHRCAHLLQDKTCGSKGSKRTLSFETLHPLETPDTLDTLDPLETLDTLDTLDTRDTQDTRDTLETRDTGSGLT